MKLWRKFVLAFTLCALIPQTSAATGTLSPMPVFTGFDNTGLIVPGGLLYTYAAGTSTPAATYFNADLASIHANTNPIVLDSAGRAVIYLPSAAFKFILKTAAGVTLWTQDGIGSVPPTTVSLDIAAVAGENLTAGNAVYMTDGSTNCGATLGRFYKTDADFACSSTAASTVGIAVADIAVGDTGTVRLQGRVTDLSSLTAGSVYYLSATAGAITSSAPTNARAIGQADTTTSIILSGAVQPPFATASVAGIVSTTTQTFGGVKTFASPPVGIPTFARVTADVTKNNTTTFGDVTALSLTVGASEEWFFDFVLKVVGNTVANAKWQLTGPAAPTSIIYSVVSSVTPTAGNNQAAVAFSSSVATNLAGANDTEMQVRLTGYLRNGVNAGTVQLQFAQLTANASNLTVRAESFMVAMRRQ